ncbi:unnamed protein product [Phytophthora lilii]|uniref:Unnamed protein product n=1 Tax=Phytophthora lilii TaxID=2077276 RepID=A0A9W6U095_9STRA|nr:unnamed protein product [Phytophthora lilii]
MNPSVCESLANLHGSMLACKVAKQSISTVENFKEQENKHKLSIINLRMRSQGTRMPFGDSQARRHVCGAYPFPGCTHYSIYHDRKASPKKNAKPAVVTRKSKKHTPTIVLRESVVQGPGVNMARNGAVPLALSPYERMKHRLALRAQGTDTIVSSVEGM